jgi:protein-tyrosine phosphatase
MNDPIGERRLPFEGAVNFRDLGGYDVGAGRRTRWRRVYRSDSLADLTEPDVARLAALGLHCLIDFRLPHEREGHPNRLPAGVGFRSVELGFWPDGVAEMHRQFLAGALDEAGMERVTMNFYRNFPLHHAAEYRFLLETIENAAGRPTLFHCVSGKDRTGFGAAVILMALGASPAVILEDYALTSAYRRDIRHLIPAGTPDAVAQAFTAANPIYLDAALAVITQTYGSVDAYLELQLGFDDKRRADLRDLLTEASVPRSGIADAAALD